MLQAVHTLEVSGAAVESVDDLVQEMVVAALVVAKDGVGAEGGAVVGITAVEFLRIGVLFSPCRTFVFLERMGRVRDKLPRFNSSLSAEIHGESTDAERTKATCD